jgi:serine/threonine protein kinase/Tol biopolymer transport system component
MVGRTFGSYTLTACIGAGGMGEVYRARDSKLGRDVAVKVLPPHFTSDPERRSRFAREARVLATLNHPNIATIHGLEDSDGMTALVLELVEGESLADRLERGPLPSSHAITIAAQIADALDAAHEKGIVHRDLKPANIVLQGGAPDLGSSDLRIKVLDFGVAKLVTERFEGVATSVVNTREGQIVGTPAYMSPEQARGQAVDARTDVWAFGCVLYEMIVGRAAFRGATASDTIATILEGDPDWQALPASTPSSIRRLLRRCLEKDPKHRLRAVADVNFDLEEARAGNTQPPGTAARTRSTGWVITATVVALASAAAPGAAAVILFQSRAVSSLPIAPKRFVVTLPDLQFIDDGRTFSVVPDGSGIVYLTATAEDSSRIHLYRSSDGVSRALGGTERAMHPTVSPDGKWVAFYRSNRLMKVAIAGGPPVEIAAVSYVLGVSWSADDWIVFASASGLQRVPAGGGEAQTLTTLAAGEFRHTSPHVLPDGKAVLFTALSRSGTQEDAEICVVSVATRERRTLVKGAGDARYSSSGHLLYVRQADLLAVPFDPKRLQASGTPFLAAASIQVKPTDLAGSFDLAGDGTLAWIASSASDLQRMLVWIDRKGVESPLPVPVRPYSQLALMPDERSAIVELEATPHNLWHLDLASGALTSLTHEGANHRPVVSPDGRFFAFSSDRTTPRSLFRQPTDGSGAPERLVDAAAPQNVTSWSENGRWLLFEQSTQATRDDIWVLALDGGTTPHPLMNTAASERHGTLSPDGRWIAYSTDESGRREVVIRSFPGDGPRKQVSTAGGETPSFSGDGKTLFYRLKDQIWAVPMSTDPALTIGRPSPAFKLSGVRTFTGLPNYVVSRAGDRVLAAKTSVEARRGEIQVMVNWPEELRQRVSTR